MSNIKFLKYFQQYSAPTSKRSTVVHSNCHILVLFLILLGKVVLFLMLLLRLVLSVVNRFDCVSQEKIIIQ